MITIFNVFINEVVLHESREVMKFEVLKKNNLKRNIIIGVFVVLIISAVILNFTSARYRSTASVPIVNSTVNYTRPDLNVVAMYQKEDGGEYVSIDTVPTSGYELNTTESYCKVGDEVDSSIPMSYEDGKVYIGVVNKGTKCYLYFDELSGPPSYQTLTKLNLTVNEGTPDFSKIDPAVITYKEVIISETTSNYASNSTYVTYADTYDFDITTGTYSLVNPQVGIYSNIYQNLVGKYIITTNHQSTSTPINYTDVTTIYEITSAELGPNNSRKMSLKRYYHHSDQLDSSKSGIYSTEDNDGTSYYFRGNVKNNYVKFGTWNKDEIYFGYYTNSTSYKEFFSLEECQANSYYGNNCTLQPSRAGKDMYWRIVRINGDGTIRLVYDGTDLYENGVSSKDRQYTTTTLYNNNGTKEYGSFTYVTGLQRPNNEESATASMAKETLDKWYNDNLKVYETYIATDGKFCNDRELREGYTWEDSSVRYESMNRMENHIPTLKCNNELDIYNTSVGLLTLDELIYAGGSSSNNFGYYLYTGNGFWTMTPSYTGTIYNISENGNIYTHNMLPTAGIRPVINLKANVPLIGTGTIDDPFRLSES